MRERIWEKPKQHASLQAMSARKKKNGRIIKGKV